MTKRGIARFLGTAIMAAIDEFFLKSRGFGYRMMPYLRSRLRSQAARSRGICASSLPTETR
jgi:hypothetical protein